MNTRPRDASQRGANRQNNCTRRADQAHEAPDTLGGRRGGRGRPRRRRGPRRRARRDGRGLVGGGAVPAPQTPHRLFRRQQQPLPLDDVQLVFGDGQAAGAARVPVRQAGPFRTARLRRGLSRARVDRRLSIGKIPGRGAPPGPHRRSMRRMYVILPRAWTSTGTASGSA